jgi:histone-lysine N-methyltransferase SETMAR
MTTPQVIVCLPLCLKMAKNSEIEQRAVIKFLSKEGNSAPNIYKRLKAVYDDTALSRKTVYRWIERFESGRESISDEQRKGRPKVVSDKVHVEVIQQMILNDRRVTLETLSENSGISHGSVFNIIHNELLMSKVSCRWVPRMLSADQKQVRMEISGELLARYSAEGAAFLSRIVTGDETWMHFYEPEGKRQSMQWKHTESPTPTKFKLAPSVGKVLYIFFWDQQGIILCHPVPKYKTINAEYYSNVLTSKLLPALQEKRPQTLKKGVLLQHDNARPHTAHRTVTAVTEMGWETLPHPPYSPDLAPSDYHLFSKVKESLRGKKFQSRSALGSAINHSTKQLSKQWFLTGIQNLPERWKKCIAIAGEYIEQ